MLDVTAAVIVSEGKLLICRRPAGKRQALLWEFPGGKIEPGETAEQCLLRECREELDIRLRIHRKLTELIFPYPEGDVRLQFFQCGLLSAPPRRKEHAALAWAAPEELGRYAFCPADARMLAAVPADELIRIVPGAGV